MTVPRLPFMVGNIASVAKPKGKRGGHAHRTTRQIVWCTSGTFLLKCGWDTRWQIRRMERNMAVLVEPMTLLELEDFSDDASYLVMFDRPYDPKDYIHNEPHTDHGS